MPEIYISTDVETDGPIPGPNSMPSFASAAFRPSGEQVGTFSANVELLPGASPDPATEKFWADNAAAYDATRTSLRDPAVAMPDYVAWVKSMPGKPVFVAYPAGFDFLFVYWYLIKFAGESPFSHSALDMKTMAMVLLGKGYRDSTKRNMPRAWFGPGRHTHVALDDAIEQGELFCNMLRAAQQLRGAK
jgi:hypothetical protein